MSLYKRGNVFWSRIMRDGKVFVRSTKKRNRPDAIRVEATWINAIDSGEPTRPDRLILSDFETRFLEYVARNVKAAKTRAYYKTHWAPLRDSPLGRLVMRDIRARDIEEWTQARSQKVSPASVNASLRTLRRAMRLAQEWDVVKSVPKIRLVTGEHSREYVISERTLAAMLANERCTPVLRDLIVVLYDTGLRLNEAMELTWSTVGRSIFVAKGKSKAARRTVPLTERAKEVFTRRRPEDASETDRVFDISPFTISHQFKVLRDALKLPTDCVLHSFRHTYLTRLGRSGASPFEIKRLAGHSSVAISERYVHSDQETLASAVERLQRVERGDEGG